MANVLESERLGSCSNEMELCNTAKKLKTEDIDRISALPDEVVSFILCFLSTKEAVATSVLSKRWRSVWTLAPDLQYYLSEKGSLKCRDPSILSEQTESFLRFFWDRVKPLGKSFSQVRLEGFFDDRLGDVVMEIMAHKVRELDVCTIPGTPAKFHYSLLSSETLVSLKMDSISFPQELSVHLPRLKILHLNWIGKISKESICEFISGCPVLEDFFLCKRKDSRSLESLPILFFSQTLVSLKLKGKISFHVPFRVHLPRLKVFHLEGACTMHDEFLGNLLAGCPLLEVLHFKYRSFNFKPIHLPLYISKTLVSLELAGRFSFHVLSSIYLPCLRFLHLGSVTTVRPEFLHNLLSGCPVLEIMHLRDACPKWSENVSICIPALKCLELDLLYSYPTGYKLEIVAPALKDLRVHFRSCFNGKIAWNFPNIEKAHVDYDFQSPRDLLRAIRNTKVLELTCGGRGDGSLPQDIQLIPKFQYLEFLQIRDYGIFAHRLPKILENSPNLKKLVIEREDPYDCKIFWSLPPLVPHCLLHTLKAFRINNFSGLSGEMEMVNYFLSNAQMLEKVKVQFSILDAGPKLPLQKKLSALHHCSSTCQLKFV